MSVFKCKMCGGMIEPSENGIGICDSCGTKQTISNTNDEKKMNLLDRANHFRMQNDFDKAMSIYEQILDEDTTDSDVYYAIALCRYGITYVDDPKTNRKTPTINRLQKKEFTEDADYLMALKYAEPNQATLYSAEGAYIDKVQQGIMDITKNEKPYDVFICYKETDDSGNRTHDSVLANDLYYGLTNEGFKVFFARITLEGKLGIAYEPYIFSALNSSKVMVVLGTKPEHFNAVWVKNEWSRFLSLINDGANKTLIPAYKDMDPYDLPIEFANLQAQDMSKLGFMQDLIRGIKKILDDNRTINVKNETNVTMSSNDDRIKSFIKRIKIFLEDGNFEQAYEYCEKALDVDAENGEIYLYELLSANKLKNIESLSKNASSSTFNSTFYKNAYKFSSNEFKGQLENIKNQAVYNNAINLFENQHINAARKEFEYIKEYKDATDMIEKCNNILYTVSVEMINHGEYNDAIQCLETIKEYKDAKELIIKCIYNMASDYMNQKKYDKALEFYGKIIDYLDSEKNARLCFKKYRETNLEDTYMEAYNLFIEEKYNTAKEMFKNMLDLWKAESYYLACCNKKGVNVTDDDRKLIELLKQNKNIDYFEIYFLKQNIINETNSVLLEKAQQNDEQNKIKRAKLNSKIWWIIKIVTGLFIIAIALNSCNHSGTMGYQIFGFIVFLIGVAIIGS